MKDSTQVSSVTPTNRLSQEDDDSYGGLIEVPLSKKISVATTKLISYFDHYAQYPDGYTKFLSFIMVFQFLAPALLMASEAVWDQKDPSGVAMSIMSIFAHIIPVPYRLTCQVYMLYIFNIIFVLLVIAFLGCSFYYSKYTKINLTLAKVLSCCIPLIYVYSIAIAQTCAEFGTTQNKNHADVDASSMGGFIMCVICFVCDIFFLSTTFSDNCWNV